MSSPPSTLLVEDDDHLADSLTQVFTEANIPIERARDWGEGLAMFRAAGHELVIADYNLPGSDHGLLLLLQVKVRLPSTKLVLVSGALTEQAEKELEPLRLVDAYFRKTSKLANELMPWVESAAERATAPTRWESFADGHLADPEAQRAEAERIDQILRASLPADE